LAGRESRPPRTVLEYLLQRQDRTYEEVGREFEKIGRQLDERGVSITPRHLRRLASGERAGTTPATRRVLQAMFSVSAGELLQPYDPSVPVPGAPAETSVRLIQSDVELLTMAAERSRDFALARHLPVSAEAVAQLTEEVGELARDFPVTPLPHILGRLVQTQDAVLAQLELRQKPGNARQLYFLATIIGGLLGYAADDVGKPQLALTHTRTAFMWAEYADHNGLRAWIRGLQSLICYWANQPHQAVRYAQAGIVFADTARSTSAPWLYACEARARAALGDAAETKALIDAATRAQERVTRDELDEFGGVCSFYPSQQTYYAARALASLPSESALAERYGLAAVEAYTDEGQPGWDFSCQADSRLALALARVSRRELDGVADALLPVFQLPPEQRIHDLIKTMNVVHLELTKLPPQPQVRQLQEEIESFTRASLPQFPV
jgi:hypothetical protein